MENNNPIMELLEEPCSMSLEELEAARPEFLAQTDNLSEKVREICTRAIDLVIEQKREKLQATT